MVYMQMHNVVNIQIIYIVYNVDILLVLDLLHQMVLYQLYHVHLIILCLDVVHIHHGKVQKHGILIVKIDVLHKIMVEVVYMQLVYVVNVSLYIYISVYRIFIECSISFFHSYVKCTEII